MSESLSAIQTSVSLTLCVCVFYLYLCSRKHTWPSMTVVAPGTLSWPRIQLWMASAGWAMLTWGTERHRSQNADDSDSFSDQVAYISENEREAQQLVRDTWKADAGKKKTSALRIANFDTVPATWLWVTNQRAAKTGPTSFFTLVR